MKNINKTIVAISLALVAALPTIASAATIAHSWLKPDYQRTHRVWIPKGEHTIEVTGDGSSDLDLYVETLSGKRIDCDELYDDNPVVTINVSRAGNFNLVVVNHGDSTDEYDLDVR